MGAFAYRQQPDLASQQMRQEHATGRFAIDHSANEEGKAALSPV